MIKKALWFLVLALSVSACKQPPKTTLKDKTHIAGTRIYIDLPEGFVPSKDSKKVYESGETTLTFVDLHNNEFQWLSNGFNKNHFELNYDAVLDFKRLQVDGYQAKMVHLQDTPNKQLLQLLFGCPDFVVHVNAEVPKTEYHKLESIRDALEGIVYDFKRKP